MRCTPVSTPHTQEYTGRMSEANCRARDQKPRAPSGVRMRRPIRRQTPNKVDSCLEVTDNKAKLMARLGHPERCTSRSRTDTCVMASTEACAKILFCMCMCGCRNLRSMVFGVLRQDPSQQNAEEVLQGTEHNGSIGEAGLAPKAAAVDDGGCHCCSCSA